MALHALIADDLVRAHGPRRVLDGVSLTASPGKRIGVIGENGIGKSTLLRLLAGVDQPDAGRVQRPDDVGFLRQEMAYQPSATVQQVVEDALRESRQLLADPCRNVVRGPAASARARHRLRQPARPAAARRTGELQDAFGGAPGALVVATHDRWLRARWAGVQLHLPDS